MYCTSHFGSHHILATLCNTPPRLASDNLHKWHCTAFYLLHISFNSTTSVWPWSHPIPHPTTTFQITRSTPPHSTSHHITFRVTTPLPALPRIAPCHSPQFHITQRSTFHATHTNPYYTTNFHKPFQFERLELYVIRFVRLSFTYNLLYHTSIKPNTKMVKKCNFIHKVPEKVIPVCPNTNLFWVVVYLIVTLHTNQDCWSEPAVLGENDYCFSSSSSVFLLTPSVCQTDMLHVVAHKLWSHLFQGWISAHIHTRPRMPKLLQRMPKLFCDNRISS